MLLRRTLCTLLPVTSSAPETSEVVRYLTPEAPRMAARSPSTWSPKPSAARNRWPRSAAAISSPPARWFQSAPRQAGVFCSPPSAAGPSRPRRLHSLHRRSLPPCCTDVFFLVGLDEDDAVMMQSDLSQRWEEEIRPRQTPYDRPLRPSGDPCGEQCCGRSIDSA